jgi:hypothetical protein
MIRAWRDQSREPMQAWVDAIATLAANHRERLRAGDPSRAWMRAARSEDEALESLAEDVRAARLVLVGPDTNCPGERAERPSP